MTSPKQTPRQERCRHYKRGGPTGNGNGSYESFVEQHCTRLVQSLSLISQDRELAWDAAQDAFLKLYLRWDTVGDLRDPVAWLYRVALNRFSDYRRIVARAARLNERLGNTGIEPWTEPRLGDTELALTFKALPRRQRVAATLYYLADLSTEEVARVMGVSRGTVDRHLYRARVALRSNMEGES
jgi:RNA polymerase sigma factor (sigma-70 family)